MNGISNYGTGTLKSIKLLLKPQQAIPGIPSYSNAAQKIAEVNAQFKFIYIMRDPLERIKSHYNYSKVKGFVETQNKTSEEIDWRIIEATKYYKQIDEYYQRFPASDILLLDFATLKQNPTRLLREICLFLDIDSEYEFKVTKAHNVSKNLIVNSPIWNLMRKNLLLQSGVKKIIPQKQKNMLRSMLGSKFKEEIEFSATQRQSILNELQPDLGKLKLHYSFDTSSWKI